MDDLVQYTDDMPYTKVGLYFVESNLYFPIRGNVWYSHVMVKYLMERELIAKYNITYALYSSLTIKKDYFDKFIDYVYDKKDGYDTFLIICMIGVYKPSKRASHKSIAIGTDRHVIFNHFLRHDATFIWTFEANNQKYYSLLGKYGAITETSETPIYNQPLELELLTCMSYVKR